MPLGELTFDPLRIRQVLINFIDNAIKYTEHGTVTVSLSKEEGDVVLRCTTPESGSRKGELDRMFTKFYRAENARQMVTSGSGLGLFVAKRIIEDHHATPIIESVEGSGSTFGFRVPVAAVTVARDTAAPGLAADKP
ncbi:MAG: ATP-binding protein [Hymenobacter sp.]